MFRRSWVWLWEYIDTLTALLLALVFSIAGIAGWVKPELVPPATLGLLTILAFTLMRERTARKRTDATIRSLLEKIQNPSADKFFQRGTSEVSLLQEAENGTWFVQETGSLLTERNREEIIRLLLHGRDVRFVLSAPTEFSARLVAFRNASLNYQTILARHHQCRGQLDSILQRTGQSGERLQVRYVPFPVDATTVIVDPESPIKSRQKGLVRHTGFGIPHRNKLDFSLSGESSPEIFAHFYQEARILFQNASKIVLLQGAPHSGKTTLMQSLVELHGTAAEMFYVITRAVGSSDNRTGFEVLTTARADPKPFATKRPDGDYEVNAGELVSLVDQIEAAYRTGKIILLDEIGPLQLQSPTFVEIVSTILNDPRATLFATVAEAKHPFLDSVRMHYRATTIRLRPDATNAVRNRLSEEMISSLRLARYIPLEMWGNIEE